MDAKDDVSATVCTGEHVLEWDLGVPTGEWEERDANSKGKATYEVTHEE